VRPPTTPPQTTPPSDHDSNPFKEGTPVSTTSTNRRHLTIADLCEELGVARSTFYDWRAAKKAPRCIKLPNGEIRIRRTDLERWLEELEDAA
jgi:excisionase family DNA binding protein